MNDFGGNTGPVAGARIGSLGGAGIRALSAAAAAALALALAGGTAVVPAAAAPPVTGPAAAAAAATGLATAATPATAAGTAAYLPPAQAPASVAAATKKVTETKTTANLNLRKGASTRHASLKVLKKGTVVSVLSTSKGWSRIKAGSTTGWVSARYLKTTTRTVAVADPVRYTKDYTQLRASADTKSKVLANLQRRTKVDYLGTSKGYSKVRHGKTTGWIPNARLAASSPAVVHRWVKTKATAYAKADAASARRGTVAQYAKLEWRRNHGAFQEVRTPDGWAWVESSKLSAAEVRKTTHRWTTHQVNVRKGAGTNHKSLGTVPAWERTEFLRTSGGWSQLKTSRGTGWIKNTYLSTHENYPVAVYGTLRKGQSAYFLLKGKTAKEQKTRIVSHNLYLRPDVTWWSFIVPSKSAKHTVVAERMELKKPGYTATLAQMDQWERFDPKKPLADQNYNRRLVVDADGRKAYAYVAGEKIAKYLERGGIKVAGGDYLDRY